MERTAYHFGMSDPDISSILNDLAAGRIDAAEAGRRIDAAKAGASASEPLRETPQPEEPQPSGPTGVKGTDRVTIRAVGRRVRVIGDASVATVSVDGEHVLRRQGSELEITSDGELGPTLEGFSMLRLPRNLEDLKSLSLARALTVRVNPAIEADVEVTAGSLQVTGVPFIGRVRVTAGSVQVDGARRATDVLVQAGQANVKGAFNAGRSRLVVQSGSLAVTLLRGSNVTVHADAQVGAVKWPGESGAVDELVLGAGNARLDIEAVMGTVQITREED